MTILSAQKISVGALLVALLIILPLIANSGFALTVMSQGGVAIILALAFNMLLGQGGMLSFGHAIYFGLAGYFTAHVLNGMASGDLPYVPVSLIPLAGGLAGLFFGILIGFVSTRRAGTAPCGARAVPSRAPCLSPTTRCAGSRPRSAGS